MISANNITLRVGKKALFEDVNIKFPPGNCYWLIGANGAGKSTFLKLLSGEIETSHGEIIISKDERIAVLKQNHYAYDEYTAIELDKELAYSLKQNNFSAFQKEEFRVIPKDTPATGIEAILSKYKK